jgi:hypothetical protein
MGRIRAKLPAGGGTLACLMMLGDNVERLVGQLAEKLMLEHVANQLNLCHTAFSGSLRRKWGPLYKY